MATQIHPQAIVEEGAELGENIVVEAFVYIGAQARVGDDCHLRHHATVEGNVELGKENQVHPYALVGGMSHDLKYKGGQPKLRVGDRNVFREYVTAHVATNPEDATVGIIGTGGQAPPKYCALSDGLWGRAQTGFLWRACRLASAGSLRASVIRFTQSGPTHHAKPGARYSALVVWIDGAACRCVGRCSVLNPLSVAQFR